MPDAADQPESAEDAGGRGVEKPGGGPEPQAGDRPTAPAAEQDEPRASDTGSMAGSPTSDADQTVAPAAPERGDERESDDAARTTLGTGGGADMAQPAPGLGAQPGYQQPAYGPPGYGHQADEPTGHGQPGYGGPAYEVPGYGQPGYGGPPGYGQPGYGQQPTGHGQPSYGPPAYGVPGYGQPGYGQPPGHWPPGYGPPGYVPPGYGPPAYGGGPGGHAPRPGIVPLAPLGIGEILGGAVGYVRANPLPTLGVSAVVMVVTGVIQMVGELALPQPDPADLAAGRSGTFAVATLGQFGSAVAGLVLSALLGGLLLVVLSRAVLGQHIGLRAAWQAVAPRLPGLVGLSLLIGLIVGAIILVSVLPSLLVAATGSGRAISMGGLLVLVAVFAVAYLAVLWALAPAAYVLEPVGVVAALGRSRALVRGAWWRTFGTLLFAGFVVAVPAVVVMGLFGGFSLESQGAAALVRTALALAVIGTFAAPFGTGVTGLIYVDRRIRRERFDVDLARMSSGRPG
jgi:hypothetical protein